MLRPTRDRRSLRRPNFSQVAQLRLLPLAVYFPQMHGAVPVEPNKTESKDRLDQFIGGPRSVLEPGRAGGEVLIPRRNLGCGAVSSRGRGRLSIVSPNCLA